MAVSQIVAMCGGDAALRQITLTTCSVGFCYECKWTKHNSIFNWKVLLFKFTKYGAYTTKV